MFNLYMYKYLLYTGTLYLFYDNTLFIYYI